MKHRSPMHPSTVPMARLTPLASPPTPKSGIDDRCESPHNDPVATALAAAAARAPPKKYPRLQTLSSLIRDHVSAMHNGAFVARSRERWEQHPKTESDRMRAHRLSRESAALVIQSAWRRSTAVRLRARLLRAVWQQQMGLAAWLTRDREELRVVLTSLLTDTRRPLAAARHVSTSISLSGAYVRLPALLLATWLCFTLGCRRRSRFLRRPAPVILHAVHIPIRTTCRLYSRLWKESTRVAARAIQCRARTFLSRCIYWRLVLAHRRCLAAVRLQALYRAWFARRYVWRLRRRRAAIRIQCRWRCVCASRRVHQRRISVIANHFFTGVTVQAVEHASIEIIQHAARQIQRTFRGQRARAQFRGLVARRQQQQWHQNPSRGYRLFAKQSYFQAAAYLEQCFRQGIFQDNVAVKDTTAELFPRSRGRIVEHHHQHRLVPSGSRLTYSFSEAPTPLDPDLVHDGARRLLYDRRPVSPSHDLPHPTRLAPIEKQLEFWQTYALSHWFSFQSNGDALHLRQARVGFETFLRVGTPPSRGLRRSTVEEAEFQFLCLHSRVCLVYCVYWSSKPQSSSSGNNDTLALSLCIEALDELDMLLGLMTSDMVHQATVWRTQLLVISASLYLNDRDMEACCVQLHILLTMVLRGECTEFDEIELRFLLAIVLLTANKGSASAPTAEAEEHLRRCYQELELWPGVGFYHGEVSSLDAAARLQEEPVGSFLLHHDVAVTDSGPADTTSSRKLLLKVKLSEEPCKVSSLRIHQDDGVYSMRKIPNCSHFSVHELIQRLPQAAGVNYSLGVRRGVYLAAVEKKLSSECRRRAGRRALMLPWEQWCWRTSPASSRHNECWGALCQLFAVRLEASNAHEMAALVARDGLLVARDRGLRADLFFTMGRVNIHLQRRVDAALAIKQATIESARLQQPFNRNFAAITHAFSHMGTLSHSFSNQLERIAKLERMCVKAWSFDSCSPTLRGYPFCEALLLQRVDDEVDHECVADTFFLRALLRAHTKAFLNRGLCESSHIELACTCVQRLFERFYIVSTSTVESSGLHGCFRHTLSTLGGHEQLNDLTSSSEFSVQTLLLIWHRIPFQVAFEMAEVFYRLPFMNCQTLIDVYESLYGRLRSVKPRNWAYAAYEELLLVRVAFLYAQRASEVSDETTPVVLMRKAIDVMDELIGLRRLRALGSQLTVTVKRVLWPPRSLQLPLYFSLHELIFMRGFLWEQVSNLDRNSNATRTTAHANAWRDFDGLHRELLALVMDEQGQQHNTSQQQKKLKGVRIFVGDTTDVGVTDMYHSKPFVVVQCEKHQLTTQQAATWMNRLSPGWNEYIEINVTSLKTRLIVTVMNRSTRLRRRQLSGDQVLGSVQFHMEELLIHSATQRSPQWYDLISHDRDTSAARTGSRPRIQLGFQLMMEAIPKNHQTACSRRLHKKHGNWDIDELKLQLHGDLRRFVGNPWIWRWYGHKWLDDKEFSIAVWFFQRVIDTTEHESVAHAIDVISLATCYRGTMGSAWFDHARVMLEEALVILQEAYRTSSCRDSTLRKHLDVVLSMLEAQQTPLRDELAKRIPASSHWIAMRMQHEGSKSVGIYYFNEDTCERFHGVESEPHLHVPLEWESDSEQILIAVTSRNALRRIVILTNEMKVRVQLHCDLQQALHKRDPHQWVAVFNHRKQIIQYLSLASGTHSSDKSAVVITTEQPALYAMVADEHLMYHVLVVQDAFRKFQRRRQRQRRLRGLLVGAFAFARERKAAQLRIAQRAEAERKRQLNCLHVIIERATKLRAMDLFTSDPFVVVELVDADGDVVATGQTHVKRNTLNPQWHEEFRFLYAFVDHNQAQRELQQQPPILRLWVFDRDIVRTNQRDDDVAKEAIDKVDPDDDEDDTDDAMREKHRKHDFLGLAKTPIAPLVHGKCVTADLELLDAIGDLSDDEDADEASSSRPRGRGTLTISVQWIHDTDDHSHLIKMRRNAIKPMLLVRPRKRTRPKPMLSPLSRELVDAVITTWELTLSHMGAIAVLLDQLVRLFNRWRVAQKSGWTADEAKLMEQRLHAATIPPQPFYTKYAELVASVDKAKAAMESVLRIIEMPIHDWVESCEEQTARTLATTLTTSLTAMRNVGSLYPWDPETHAFVGQVDSVLSLRQSVVLWRRDLLMLCQTFFEPPVPMWDEPDSMKPTLEQFTQIHASLHNATNDSVTRPSTDKVVATTSVTVSTTVPVSTPEAIAPAAVTPNAVVAKRMERIERERRKAKKQ